MRFRILVAANCLVAVLAAPLQAQESAQRYVTAYSDYGNGTLSAPVRFAQYGMQVRLPGGTWIYCERSSLIFGRNRPCSETLRREALDFWETRDEELSPR